MKTSSTILLCILLLTLLSACAPSTPLRSAQDAPTSPLLPSPTRRGDGGEVTATPPPTATLAPTATATATATNTPTPLPTATTTRTETPKPTATATITLIPTPKPVLGKTADGFDLDAALEKMQTSAIKIPEWITVGDKGLPASLLLLDEGRIASQKVSTTMWVFSLKNLNGEKMQREVSSVQPNDNQTIEVFFY